MLDSLISSKTRLKLLLRFFLNPRSSSYLRGLENELGENSNAIRVELNRLVKSDFLVSDYKGNKKIYKANVKHPLFPDLQSIIRKYIGIDHVIEMIIKRLGKLERAYVLADYAKGKDSGIIDLLLIGDIDREYLNELVPKAESLIKRKIRYLLFKEGEDFEDLIKKDESFLIWGEE